MWRHYMQTRVSLSKYCTVPQPIVFPRYKLIRLNTHMYTRNTAGAKHKPADNRRTWEYSPLIEKTDLGYI